MDSTNGNNTLLNSKNAPLSNDPGDTKNSRGLRILMPVALPLSKKELAARPGGDLIVNNFTPISVDLDQSGSTAARVSRTVTHLHKLAASVYAPVSLWLSNFAAGVLPTAVTQDTLVKIFERHCCMFSNVRGYVEIEEDGDENVGERYKAM